MEALFFYLFAALAIVGALLVVWNPFTRNTVTNAMFLVVTMLSISGLFVLLHAYFLAAVQVIVYAGAVMVLFLFVIMLLDLQEDRKRRLRIGSVGLALLMACFTISAFWKTFFNPAQLSESVNSATFEGSTSALGASLFVDFLLPFEIISVLLLVAMLGVILLSKKELK